MAPSRSRGVVRDVPPAHPQRRLWRAPDSRTAKFAVLQKGSVEAFMESAAGGAATVPPPGSPPAAPPAPFTELTDSRLETPRWLPVAEAIELTSITFGWSTTAAGTNEHR